VITDIYDNIVKTAQTVFAFHSNYLEQSRIYNPCPIKGDSGLGWYGEGVKKFDTALSSITSIIKPSDNAAIDIGPLMDHYSRVDSTCIGYKLLAPILGGYGDSGNLVSGFLTFSANSMAGV